MVGIFNIMDFLKSEKEIAERLDGILTTWDSTPEIKTAKGKGQISYEQQEPGTILIKVGFDEYIIELNTVYAESPYLTSQYNEGHVEIAFLKLNKYRTGASSDYIEIGDKIGLYRNGKLYNKSNNGCFHQFNQEAHLGIFMVMMERIIEDKNFIRG
ncbi:MAG TPA: hypothetical protein DIW48_00655 [Sphaerochaeta sp.]|nr:hypothetical protein [Sphaerochaeta sp.]HCS35216.1 hypothetical protein [Sphaerochaeta sp.]